MTTEDQTKPTRRLYRSRDDKMIAGIAGGLAEYLGVDPVLVRIAFVALALAMGSGVLLYLIAWLIIPEKGGARAPAGDYGPPPASAGSHGSHLARIVVGSVLVVIGGLLLLDWVIPDLSKFFWPVALIGLGVGLFTYGARR
jgi:phage shock protein C